MTWALYEQGKKFTSGDYLTAVEKIQGISRDVARFFMDYDIFMTPTLGEPPLLIGEMDATADPYVQQFIHGRADGPIESVR